MVQKAASTLYLCQDVCGEVSGGDGGLKLSIKLSASLHPAVVLSVGPLLTRTLRNYEDEDTHPPTLATPSQANIHINPSHWRLVHFDKPDLILYLLILVILCSLLDILCFD